MQKHMKTSRLSASNGGQAVHPQKKGAPHQAIDPCWGSKPPPLRYCEEMAGLFWDDADACFSYATKSDFADLCLLKTGAKRTG